MLNSGEYVYKIGSEAQWTAVSVAVGAVAGAVASAVGADASISTAVGTVVAGATRAVLAYFLRVKEPQIELVIPDEDGVADA